MQINIPWKRQDPEETMFLLPSSTLSSGSVPGGRNWAKPLQIQYKIILKVLTVFPFMPNFVL